MSAIRRRLSSLLDGLLSNWLYALLSGGGLGGGLTAVFGYLSGRDWFELWIWILWSMAAGAILFVALRLWRESRAAAPASPPAQPGPARSSPRPAQKPRGWDRNIAAAPTIEDLRLLSRLLLDYVPYEQQRSRLLGAYRRIEESNALYWNDDLHQLRVHFLHHCAVMMKYQKRLFPTKEEYEETRMQIGRLAKEMSTRLGWD
jgi:hypothetical protein